MSWLKLVLAKRTARIIEKNEKRMEKMRHWTKVYQQLNREHQVNLNKLLKDLTQEEFNKFGISMGYMEIMK